MKSSPRKSPSPSSLESKIDALTKKVDQVLKRLSILTIQGEIEMASIDDILNDVSDLDDINDSLDALFTQLQALIEAGKTDPAKLQQAHDIISAQKERTKAAIVANTPAAPPTP